MACILSIQPYYYKQENIEYASLCWQGLIFLMNRREISLFQK
ncbi:hypothetical protein CpecG_0447 [Chlamydia pecorum MC/MarsBar]|nr:hypothetical protein CpecS_0451 [Chlamydia pecorum VR629]ETF39347.1 hypothetical protein CpecF_0447 [Chlamydia pecorum DBDeUG]ETF40022.1 hypothetical protein CpecG_0447 [Chlamydia pecorum MC/MarsBar]ETF40554.1 hypothetical protein CpecA_0448 [Chlamydia pecorum IPTaLE]